MSNSLDVNFINGVGHVNFKNGKNNIDSMSTTEPPVDQRSESFGGSEFGGRDRFPTIIRYKNKKHCELQPRKPNIRNRLCITGAFTKFAIFENRI